MRRERGVSLVEALVALAVMGFGMLAIVGIQSTMRLNADVAKQRSEAVRIAQEAMERARGYSTLASVAGRSAFDDIVDIADQTINDYTTNTTYKLSRTVLFNASEQAQNQKSVQVRVEWTDRAGTLQSVQLNTVIARADPALAALLVTPPAGSPSLHPRKRHPAIPFQAKDMGDGTSAFKPPQPFGGPVVWVFNNVTGYITGICELDSRMTTEDVTRTDIASCNDNTLAQLLSGYVRFATGLTQPTAADAEQPTGQARNLRMSLTLTSSGHPAGPSCFDDAPISSSLAMLQTTVAYYCAIPANSSRSWSGYSTIEPRRFFDESFSSWSIPTTWSASSTHKLCRYTPAASDTQWVPNWQHPFKYRVEYADPGRETLPLPMPPLANQNFLVIRSEFDCPTDVAVDIANGDFVNSNTLFHRPWP